MEQKKESKIQFLPILEKWVNRWQELQQLPLDTPSREHSVAAFLQELEVWTKNIKKDSKLYSLEGDFEGMIHLHSLLTLHHCRELKDVFPNLFGGIEGDSPHPIGH